jgi:hypothetical protein
VKEHGRTYFEPIGKAIQKAMIKQPNLANPGHLWTLRQPLWNYAKWRLGRGFHGRSRPAFPELDASLKQHAEFAADFLQRSALEVSATMRKHQLKLADRQCRMAELSGRIQTAVVILCTSLYAGHHPDELIRKAGSLLASQLTNQLLGRRPSDTFLRSITELGAELSDQKMPGSDEILDLPILMPYEA